jgi:hypothetical protein
VIYRTTT